LFWSVLAWYIRLIFDTASLKSGGAVRNGCFGVKRGQKVVQIFEFLVEDFPEGSGSITIYRQ
jgi:hypothetical protein